MLAQKGMLFVVLIDSLPRDLYLMTLSLKDRQKAHTIKKAYNFLRGPMVDQFDGKTSCANSKGSI